MRLRNFVACWGWGGGKKCWALCILYIYCILDTEGTSWDLHSVDLQFESLSDRQVSSLISSWLPSVC